MIIDSLLVFDQGAYVAGTGMIGVNQYSGGVSTNILDLSQARDLGEAGDFGPSLTVQVQVTTAFTGGTSLTVQVQGSTDSSTWTTYESSAAVPTASLTAGARIRLPLPARNPADGALPRYYRLNYVTAGSYAAGAVIAWLGTVTQNTYYPPGTTVAN